ncbi:hypothetical protein BDK62_11491 [Halomonas alkaliantarctica]|jgi:hypothetical protein|nr:hypothetical protein BDK62_11491 [Halomonas alkaliantarctica]
MSVAERRAYGRWNDAGRASRGKEAQPVTNLFQWGLSARE